MSDIIDINTLFGPLPAAASDLSVDDLTELMSRHSIKACCTLSTIGMLLDHNSGNSATRAACGESPSLEAAATVNPMAFFGGDGPYKRFKADGFKLVRFFPGFQGWDPVAESFVALAQVLGEQELPIMVDVDQSGMASGLIRTLDSYEAPIILAGMDETTISEGVALMRAKNNVFVETSNLLAAGAIKQVVESVGPERILYGSGAPSRPMASGLAILKYSGLTDEQTDLVLGGNAKRMLGL
jgi:hypothetical protein